ncbi:ABC transporter ATP-binding protein [bacterium]|nr:ABC transporter ATP-binding protein [bacterium]RQV96732.1 MAG: ABC transporter ATP-binding protein [bacterium]
MSIAVENLSKWYGQVIGVNNLNFTIQPGVTGFLGPNGAGKTTLLRLLTGQLKPSKGKVTIDGNNIWNNHRVMQKVGYCPETDAFWNYLTGREFVHEMVRMHGFSEREASEKTDQALSTVNMEEAQNKRIGGYSKGMRQRIKMAQAIAHDPEILFLDEPLNGMDPLGRRATIDLVKRYGQEGKSVVVSSHILHEVEAMTDTIILINHGRLLAEGNIYEIRRLIDTHPLQVTIRCDHVNVLTSKLLEYDDVLSVQFDREKNQLTVETKRPDDFHLRLPDIALKNGVQIHSLWSPDENLEAVFDYLIR